MHGKANQKNSQAICVFELEILVGLIMLLLYTCVWMSVSSSVYISVSKWEMPETMAVKMRL